MPILDFKDNKETGGKVLAALLRMGCLVEVREGLKFVVTRDQEAALIDAGLLPPRKKPKESNSRGNSKKKA